MPVWRVCISHEIAHIDCKNDKSSNINIELVDNSPYHLRGSFPGPEGTPYEGGHFDVVCFVNTESSISFDASYRT